METSKDEKQLTAEKMMIMDPLDLHECLTQKFVVKIPSDIDSVEGLKIAAKSISKATSYFIFLEAMRQKANIQKAAFKDAAEIAEDEADKKMFKREASLMLRREQIFESRAKVMERIYQAISRLITIKQQTDKELNMTERF